jgi:hypothetical protein
MVRLLAGNCSIYPVFCSGKDNFSVGDRRFDRRTAKGFVTVTSSQNIQTIIPTDKRVYNFVPGLQALPLVFDGSDLHRQKLTLQFMV